MVAVNGLRVSGDKLGSVVGDHGVGDMLRVHAFRRDELMEFEVEPKAAPVDTCVLDLLDDVDGPTLARREAWLRGLAGSPAGPRDSSP